MLKRLSVENYALIEHLDIEWGTGLNIITGQTGAGKSILLGAVGLVSGGKADITALKDNAKNCVVEGVFNVDGYGLEEFFEQNELEYMPETVVRRIVTPAGKGRVYINDLPVQLTTLKELGARLIDIHSQHQSLMVSSEDFRMKIIDGVADNKKLLDSYIAVFSELRAAQNELSEVREEAERNSRDEEYVRFQYEQLSTLKLRDGELEELEAEEKQLSNTEQIAQTLGASAEELDADESGVLVKLKNVETTLAHTASVYLPAEELSKRVHAVLVELKDVTAEIAERLQHVEADPNRLAVVQERMDDIYTLFQKHKVDSVAALLELQADYGRRLELITDSAGVIDRLEKRIESLKTQAHKSAAAVTTSRKRATEVLGKGVEKMLERLGLVGARFVCEVTQLDELSATGGDRMMFMFSANRNSSMQPLEKIASGGEISRVMLCLKSVVAGFTKLPTIIFDEIDSGVSGRIADVTGEIIAELSQSMQVINITHLPQVASKGKDHFLVYKQEQAGAVKSNIRKLTQEERVGEIAAMLSGSRITDAAIEQAKALLG